ncbi:MAG: AIR synthase related protein [Acidimicrobiales bacterium]
MSGPAPYRSAGVDYDVLDQAKKLALRAVKSTLTAPGMRGASVLPETIGDPAQVLEVDGVVLATVLECLGTKSTIAYEVERELGLDRWRDVGTDTVAAVVNDLCCVGALPLSLSAYVATGSADWYSGERHASLVEGFRAACESTGAAWVGGESPTLAGIVTAEGVDLAGSSIGRLPPGRPVWLGSRIEAGDEIVLVASGGLHANGASLARAAARAEPLGWATPLRSGRLLGEAVLDPSALYVGLVAALHDSSAKVHYATHISGHGWRKLMRAERALTYRLRSVMAVPEVLAYLATAAGLDDSGAYGTFNMGAGFALFVAAGSGDEAARIARACGHEALVAGGVEDGPRSVVIEPLEVRYGGDELDLR